MKNEAKEMIRNKTTMKIKFLYLKNGFKELYRNPWKNIFIIIFITLALLILNNINYLYNLFTTWPIYYVVKTTITLAIIIIILMLFILLMINLGRPFFSTTINNNLLKIGLVNHIDEIPILLSKYKSKQKKHVRIFEFLNNGFNIMDFEKSREKIESILGVKILKIEYTQGQKIIIVYGIPLNISESQKIMYWKDDYLNCDDFTLCIGENPLEEITLNLNEIPHILLGGASGSGKTELLKLILMQCLRKQAKIIISDFKSGIDFSSDWQSKCDVITSKENLLIVLNDLAEELEKRKQLLREVNVSNISEYNSKEANLQRIIFACDEIAELLDKTGVSKEEKEIIIQIENKLSLFARQGRAFGIHLVLATQRPDSNILNGQIRSNIGYRLCGRADSILSSIIIDNTKASELIPSNAQGLFINQDNIVFQAYYFEDEHLL
ncbi:S-DNA-T family DNA segregation ATPase FtsK/SpoIIIE [Bacilli bacterium PM5-9]|nr:S-DNA-T family DNA segregation ATPase FtsK/SpoIIIE [Bacilli bacterium PM5-9]